MVFSLIDGTVGALTNQLAEFNHARLNYPSREASCVGWFVRIPITEIKLNNRINRKSDKFFGILESEKVPKFGNFRANSVEFRVKKL